MLLLLAAAASMQSLPSIFERAAPDTTACGLICRCIAQVAAAPRAMGHHLDWPRRLGMALDAAKVQHDHLPLQNSMVAAMVLA